ncbi:MAG: EAL domain-containing protein [Gammaproteobacteria bacterium]|nr:EAL domain-containing protein [Gammaproteobacteria bacterium]
MKGLLQTLSMSKYERLLPRIFPGTEWLALYDATNQVVWHNGKRDDIEAGSETRVWSDFGFGIGKRQITNGQLQFRSSIRSREFGSIGWLVATYDANISVPMATAPEPMRNAFADASVFIQEELELQGECNQLAIELTERYEELNLVYATKDKVEYLEEGQEALVRLVHNCADYLDVGLAVLVCRDRNLSLSSINSSHPTNDTDDLIERISTTVYDRVESQVTYVILNDRDDGERQRLFGDRSENLLAYPVVDDHGSAIGLLAVISNKDGHIFSNGDRNLLEVMTKKASRIIYTHHDSLTGLMNRSGFEPSLVTALSSARKQNQQHCLLHVDIDQLHVINDLIGHQEGDALIRRVAKSLRSNLRDSDVLARLGGDEFAVLLSGCAIDRAHSIAEKIRAAINELTVISANRQLDVSASIGVAAITPETEGIVGVMAAAEIACQSAKDSGRDRVQLFENDNTTLIRRTEEIEWIGRVQEALREDLFELHCQPVTPLVSSRNAPHFEVLIRLRNKDGEILPPGDFLPAAERYQLMPQVDRWVIRNTMRHVGKSWVDIEQAEAVFCINLSGQSLTNTGFLAFVTDELQQSQIPAKNICFEITETAAISNIDEALVFMAKMRKLGCRFSLDDFGAGLSSFGYLKVLPVDYLKIDGSFVREITTDKVSLSMVEAICQIAHTMKLSTVAEFVGDEETVDLLTHIGVDYVQGYYIGKPVPVQEIIEQLLAVSSAASA